MPTRNITIEPAAPATPVSRPEITEIFSTRSNSFIDAKRFIASHRYGRLVRNRVIIREAMHRGEPRVLCARCFKPIYLIASVNKAFSFRHAIEDGSCPAITRGELSQDQIRVLKYNGAREGEPHKQTKALIERTLHADPRVADVFKEKRWSAADDPLTYRRPDVRARFNGTALAFEAQLNTTFLDVVVGRREFYRHEGALLVWVLRWFEPHYRRMTEDDILFRNNSNVLVVTEETARASEAAGRAMFLCWYSEPYLAGEAVCERWGSRLVAIDELHFDLDQQQCYWFDHDAELERLRAEVKRARVERERQDAERLAAASAELRQETLFFLEHCGQRPSWDRDATRGWRAILDRLRACGVEVPRDYPHDEDNFDTIVSALASARAGRPIGFGWKKLVEIAHHLAEYHKDMLPPFFWALDAYGNRPLFKEQDRSGAWARKAARIAQEPQELYRPHTRWEIAIRFLFPEIAHNYGRLHVAAAP